MRRKMDLALISESEFPNGLALICAVFMVIVAFARREWWLGAAPAASTFFLGLAIVLKNWQYGLIVTDHHAENDPVAHHTFAGVLTTTWIAEVIIAATFFVAGLICLAKKDKPLLSLSALAMFASLYAALCMSDWAAAYEHEDPSTPVRYVATVPLLHWTALAVMLIMFVLFVLSVKSEVRRQRPRQR